MTREDTAGRISLIRAVISVSAWLGGYANISIQDPLTTVQQHNHYKNTFFFNDLMIPDRRDDGFDFFVLFFRIVIPLKLCKTGSVPFCGAYWVFCCGYVNGS